MEAGNASSSFFTLEYDIGHPFYKNKVLFLEAEVSPDDRHMIWKQKLQAEQMQNTV